MANKTISLTFKGYWRAANKSAIPGEAGIYCVYACNHNPRAGTVSLRRLLYIGEANNARERVSGHERRADWEAHLRVGEELCFSFSPIAASYRQRAEAALVYYNQPPTNTEYKGNFPFDTTTVNTKGKNAKLRSSITVSGWVRKSA